MGRQLALESVEYPTLRALGMTRGQLMEPGRGRTAVPVRSAILGRWAWRLVAVQLGVVSAPTVLPMQLLVIATAAVLAANLIGAGPGWAAGRLRPATVLQAVAMAFKLIESAQQRWRAVNAPHLVALVRAGARFEKGLLVERPDESGGDQQVA